MGKYSCAILMSTYNGEKYLKEQIDSILEQLDVDITIYASDDCSKDSTTQILEEYKNKCSNFNYQINKANKNFTYNFMDLAFSVPETYDYYAFADQDDIWLKDKIISAINLINAKQSNKGVLYFSNQNLVNGEMEFIAKKFLETPESTNKYAYLCGNICTGCTMVFDNNLLKLIKKYYPKNIYLHDYYVFLLAAFCGEIVYDNNAYINYRQHSSNTFGVNKKISIKKRINNAIKKTESLSIFHKELLEGYADFLNDDDKKCLNITANYKNSIKNKIKLLFSIKIAPKHHKLQYKIKMLLNKV